MIIEEAFIENLLLKAGHQEENLDLLVEDVKPVLFDWIFTHIVDKFSTEQGEEFVKMLEQKKSPKEINDFLQKNISQYDDFIEKVYQDFEDKYLKEHKAFMDDNAT